MLFRFIALFMSFLPCVAFGSMQAYAMSILQFKTNDSYEIALYDLNGDGIEEQITRSCLENSCIYTILAETNSADFITLGKIQARLIAVSNDVQNGVRNIRAYKDEMNDYNYTLYLWDAENSRYIKQQ